jgi:hypothetical protein
VNCFDRNPEADCINKNNVLEWKLAHLRPRNSLEVREMMYDSNKEIEAGTDGEWIVDNLCPSDNVAIPTTNEPFWLMLIEKGPHVVAKSFKDDANESTEGDMVI